MGFIRIERWCAKGNVFAFLVKWIGVLNPDPWLNPNGMSAFQDDHFSFNDHSLPASEYQGYFFKFGCLKGFAPSRRCNHMRNAVFLISICSQSEVFRNIFAIVGRHYEWGRL